MLTRENGETDNNDESVMDLANIQIVYLGEWRFWRLENGVYNKNRANLPTMEIWRIWQKFTKGLPKI